jgi:Flp pilus assembly protein TadG
MILVHLARLRRRENATAALEFALAAVPLMLLILGIIEAGLLFWSQEALQGVAIDTARCAGLGSCNSPSAAQSFAVSEAVSRGLNTVTTTAVSVSTGTAAEALCGNTTAKVVNISVSYQYNSISFIPVTRNLTASACYPLALDSTV